MSPDPEGAELVVGIETHVQLATATKMFCGCSAAYDGAEPNTHVCPICLGLPGTLPMPNARAVVLATRTGVALGADVQAEVHFDRKNYHYPDLPKGYQISQYDAPLAVGGGLEIDDGAGGWRRIGLERVHLEEDTGKLTHTGEATLVDFNRAGVPLLEIVSRPEIRSADEARAFLDALRRTLRWIGVSTANMEAGAMRADVNVSVRPRGAEALGVKVEIKNLNSFGAVRAAIAYEEARLAGLLARGERIVQETRGWSEATGRTVPQRTKELAEDYRYFPEPDLPPLVTPPEVVAAIAAELPELPADRRRRFAGLVGAAETARLLARDRETADYFEAVAAAYEGAPQAAATWITGPLFGLMNAAGDRTARAALRVPPPALARLVALVDAGTLTATAGRDVLRRMYETGDAPDAIVAREGLGQIDDADALAGVVAEVLSANPQAVADYCGGKTTAVGFLVGGVMKATRGQASPDGARRALEAALAERCGADG